MSHDKDRNTDECGFSLGSDVSREDLLFLRDEGLELLAAFRRIDNVEKRRAIIEYVRAVAEGSLLM